MTDIIPVRVNRREEIAQDILLFELVATDGGDLPPFIAGAHIDLFLADDMVRQYSLLNAPSHRSSYVIAVAREANGRGGSAHLHDHVYPDTVLEIGVPRCHFPLREDAPYSVLIAGGIGVTPIWCMAQQLSEIGGARELHYAARTRRHAALLDDILSAEAVRTRTYFNLEGDAEMDLPAIVAAAPPGSHFYCCGPAPMIEAFKRACSSLPAEQVHFEQFTAAAEAASEGGFTIELARTKRCIDVASGETILEALARSGISMAYSCREGVCGSCETAVLAGKPDHRDAILTEAERAEGRTMMICCSGSLSERLVLDL